MSVPLSRPDDPIAIHSRVFKGDAGWYYELKIWKGDVDVTSVAPTVVTPKKALSTKRAASKQVMHEIAKVFGLWISIGP